MPTCPRPESGRLRALNVRRRNRLQRVINSDPWLLLNSGQGEAALNMAVDEALLEAMPRIGRPVLRFYGWHERAASFGYFQKYAEVVQLTSLRPLIRRPTGGGVVPHDRDWTYSVAIPTTHDWYSVTAIESYRRIHDWIRLGLLEAGMNAQLAPAPLKTLPGQCFAGYERYDLLSSGRKIAGAAQRRSRDGLLIQGSVQLPHAPWPRTRWELSMCKVGSQHLGIMWTATDLSPELRQRAEALAANKYSEPGYNQKR